MESGEGIVPMDPALSPPAEFSPTLPPIPEAICCEQNKAVVSILIGLIVVLTIFFIVMISSPLKRCIRRHTPVSDKRIERRYETIEGWIISKVRERERERKGQRRSCCACISVRARVQSYVVLILQTSIYFLPHSTENTFSQ
jgi:hypothetical protein